LQENYWAEKYEKLLQSWAKKLEKIENSAKRRYDDAQLFGCMFILCDYVPLSTMIATHRMIAQVSSVGLKFCGHSTLYYSHQMNK